MIYIWIAITIVNFFSLTFNIFESEVIKTLSIIMMFASLFLLYCIQIKKAGGLKKVVNLTKKNYKRLIAGGKK